MCIREVQKSLEQSVKRLVDDVIKENSLSGFRSLNTHIETPGDGIIIFQGMQNHTAESIKSLEGYDIAWVEEAQTLSQNSLDLLRPTIRKPGSELWFSWNPRHATDPVDRFFRGPVPPPDSIRIEANYGDNLHFPDVLRKEMEWDKQRDPEQYAHVWLGKYKRSSEARVFKNWRVEEFTLPNDSHFLLGSDWGYAIHPTVLVRAAFQKPRQLLVDFDISQVGVEVDDTPGFFDSLLCERATLRIDGVEVARPVCGTSPSTRDACKRPTHRWARSRKIIADSARPETISYMQRHGYPRIEPSVKGAGSVEEGIKFLQNYDILVHPRCKATIDELTFYAWEVDPLTNEVLPRLADKKNHVIDSLRYLAEPLRRALAKGGLLF